jgi:MoaA/NifB/PqqE/SkfB family radical SAM enzyme
MSWEVFIKSAAIAKENRIATLNFFGGEPLLNPQFFPMLQTALENGFSIILATNCRPLTKRQFFTKFLNVTKYFKKNINIFTARDKFHLQYFEPAKIVEKLRMENYEVGISDYSNYTVLLSEYNVQKQELRDMNTHYSCCNGIWTDNIGVLPDGGWTICPPSLEAFGDIFSVSLEKIMKFKSRLPLRYKEGCSECLKDFHGFRKRFDKMKVAKGSPV